MKNESFFSWPKTTKLPFVNLRKFEFTNAPMTVALSTEEFVRPTRNLS